MHFGRRNFSLLQKVMSNILIAYEITPNVLWQYNNFHNEIFYDTK